MKAIWAAAVLSAGLAAGGAGAQGLVAPDALARSVTDEVLAILRADREIGSGNQKRVIELIESKVLPHFDSVRMTQLAVGRNWRQASPEQQKRLVEEFRTLLLRTYAAAFTAYRNQTVEYRPLRMQPNDEEVVVRSQILQPGGPPVAVDYSMGKTDRGWKVYDVAIEGVSLVQNYRSTFSAEVQRGGIEGLIKALAEKNRQLAQQAQVSRK
jgi:phospholipid transport system substrate-binding protein